MNEQIEEMARIIARRSTAFRNPNVAFMTTATKTADILYNAGYRKQREGVWIWVEDDKEEYWICTECNGRDDNGSKFCPNCGAHMRGGSDV